MATMEERFAAIEANLDEAMTELTGLIASLRTELEANGVSPAALEILGRLETKSTALKNVVPNP